MALPLSILAAVLAMQALGATINTMTLGSLVIALGALVDDAIIVVENIVRRPRENHAKPPTQHESTLHVVLLATREIQGSIVFATLLIMRVFVPLFFLSGIEGRLMVPLGLAYDISLFLGGAKEIEHHREPRFVVWLHQGYRRLPDATLERWKGIAADARVAQARVEPLERAVRVSGTLRQRPVRRGPIPGHLHIEVFGWRSAHRPSAGRPPAPQSPGQAVALPPGDSREPGRDRPGSDPPPRAERPVLSVLGAPGALSCRRIDSIRTSPAMGSGDRRWRI